MNLSEFYDNIVLRDMLEYTAPGAVVILGIAVVLEALDDSLSANTSVVPFIGQYPWHALFLLLFFGYVFGHTLTAIHTWVFRGGERMLASETLTRYEWLRSKISKTASRQLHISEADTAELLDKAETAELVRELARSIIHQRLPDLYREFVSRHSILSRFCQNMAVALSFFLLLLLVSAVVSWNALLPEQPVTHTWVTIAVVALLLFGTGTVSVVALWKRSSSLRRTMAKNTFELWYLTSLGLANE
jgi:hypothetical protein